jgi:hypothetical protein
VSDREIEEEEEEEEEEQEQEEEEGTLPEGGGARVSVAACTRRNG